MSVRTRATIVTVVTAVPAFLLTTTLFPAPVDMAPSGSQRPFFILLGGCYALALGLGFAFIAFGWPWVKRIGLASRARELAVYLAIAWLLVSWYPHGGLHTSVGMALGPLLGIEFGFHLPLIIAPLALIWGLTSRLSTKDTHAPNLGGTS